MQIMRMFSRIRTAITGAKSITPAWISRTRSAALLMLVGCIASAFTSFAANPYLVRTFEENGRLIDEIVVPPSPPPAIKEQVVAVPEPDLAAGINTLGNVPAFSWCYGCSATSAAMMMGYYDNQDYPNMYTGPANGGVCPMNNDLYWGNGESPLSATHIGKDGRTTRGHVEDYWIAMNNPGPDPYIVNGWAEHTLGDCTADFMGTSQSKFSNVDGSTTFYNNNDNSPLPDYIPEEPAKQDGCHGMKLFVNSRGYTVTENFSQYIYGYNGKAAGFTYANFRDEIDAGRPVMIQVQGHTMVGYGYNDSGNVIYIHDTWDNSSHQMTWGGLYSGMQHYGVTVLRLQSTPGSIGPKIKANGASGTISVNYPEPVSITVAMNAGSYAGTAVDWWILAFAHSGQWFYLDSSMQLVEFNGNMAFCRPVLQAPMFNLAPATVFNSITLASGIYDFWFAVDYPMDGILNPNGTILFDKVTVNVQ